MENKTTWLSIILLSLSSHLSLAQSDDSYFKRPLLGVNEMWHQFELPLDMYGKISKDLSDVRIYGYPSTGDTIEIPFVWNVAQEAILPTELPFNVINQAFTPEGQFFTIELPMVETIQDILVTFEEQNYDCKLIMEGSQNLKNWYRIVENYRILSIHNSVTDYQFGKVVFPPSQYKYFRFLIQSKDKLTLKKAVVLQSKVTEIPLSRRQHRFEKAEDKTLKTSTITWELDTLAPTNQVSLYFDKKKDFFRPFSLESLVDSTKLASGQWKYHYQTLASGTLSSLDENRITYPNIWTKKLKLTIQNHDNAPITLDSSQILGAEYTIVARFDQHDIPYFLTYGNKKLNTPTYDISHFALPKTMQKITLGNEETVKFMGIESQTPLFENKLWLWLLMGVIILLLGSLTLKMMKKV